MTPEFQTAPPARPVAPGRILRRELEARGWTNQDLADIIDRPDQAISEIMKGKKRITEENALRLGEALEMDPGFWLNLEKNYRLALARQSATETGVSRRRRLRELFPCLREIVKRGWLPETEDLNSLEEAAARFLGLKNIAEEPSMALCRRHGRSDDPDKRARQFVWAKRVEAIADAKNLSAFSRKKLDSKMDGLMQLAREEADVAKVPEYLESLGVAFVIVPRLDKTHLEGAAWPSRKNPILALTLRYDRLDNFWFNLLHELGHIRHNHNGVILDTEEDIAGDSDEEKEANEFAQRYLRRDRVEAFWQASRPAPTLHDTTLLAHTLSLHPSIVAGQLRSVSGNHRYHRKLDRKVKHLLIEWIDGE